MEIKKLLIPLFEKWSGETVDLFSPLPRSGSARIYFRLAGKSKTAIGAFNPDRRENEAFVYLTRHFQKKKLPVPQIYTADLKNGIYLLEDLGNQSLFSILTSNRKGNRVSPEAARLYDDVIASLPKFQIEAREGLNFEKCYPRPAFDKQSMLWDLNYFKYYFLKLAGIHFDEEKLEADFGRFADFLSKAESGYFMYRDFNSRNVMIKNGSLYFIDYQGGRKGALQYDLVSLLYDSKADLPEAMREELLDKYLRSVSVLKKVSRPAFMKYYYEFSLIRLLQMFGAYGYRGFFEGKSHFLQSIPYALKNLETLLSQSQFARFKELSSALYKMLDSETLRKFANFKNYKDKLTVRINSFSYRDRIPPDLTGNGGGFVFDCRAIPNPGTLEQFKNLTGRDKAVQDFLEAQPEVHKFCKETTEIVVQSVRNYMERGWTDLMVNYGCTGGQHRSVYCAEKLAKYLSKKFKIRVLLEHTSGKVKQESS